MRRISILGAVIAIAGLAGCDEAALTGAGGLVAPGGGAATGSAPGDSAFSRDENGCLYEDIGGAKVAIVDASGRQKCDRLSL